MGYLHVAVGIVRKTAGAPGHELIVAVVSCDGDRERQVGSGIASSHAGPSSSEVVAIGLVSQRRGAVGIRQSHQLRRIVIAVGRRDCVQTTCSLSPWLLNPIQPRPSRW